MALHLMWPAYTWIHMIQCVVLDIAMSVNDSRFIHIIYVFSIAS